MGERGGCFAVEAEDVDATIDDGGDLECDCDVDGDI
jgi:hypothetical protein